MNRGEIRALARKNLGETTASFWTDAELNTYINLAGHDLADKAKCIRTNGYFTTVADTAEYTLNSALTNPVCLFQVYHLTDGTTWLELDQTTKEELNHENTGWLSVDASVPQKFWYDIEENLIYLYPKPNAANAGTNYARVWYAKDYSDITSDNTTPSGIPFELQLAMVDFVTAYGYQQRGWGDKSNDSWQKYFKRIKDWLSMREDPDLIMKGYRR